MEVMGAEEVGETLSLRPIEEEEEENDEKEAIEGKEYEEEGDPEKEAVPDLGARLGATFENVGGLDKQLGAVVRRILASRSDPAAARRLGVPHVRGLLLSGPPGCGKTLLARELAALLGAREPQIVNGPEILDKFIGEAERRVRDLFAPAEREYAAVGDDSALHVIILDEFDAIGKKRGSEGSDSTGVRDSVVNQLLAKMDGVTESNNILVVGMTNRPELLDPALIRPGRLEVQLKVELPDADGRRDIFRIHTRRMKEAGALSVDAAALLEDMGDDGMAAHTKHFTGAEIAGLVRSAASFALARSAADGDGTVTGADLRRAMGEVRPALGQRDDALRARFPGGIVRCSAPMRRAVRDATRFAASPVPGTGGSPVRSLLLAGEGGGGGGSHRACRVDGGEGVVRGWCRFRAAHHGPRPPHGGRGDGQGDRTCRTICGGGGDAEFAACPGRCRSAVFGRRAGGLQQPDALDASGATTDAAGWGGVVRQ